MYRIEELNKQLDKWIDSYCSIFPFSGIIRISKNDEPIYERCIGYANREHQIPVTLNTKFRLYSMTKPFCAIALLILYDRGMVDLDDHPGEYVSLAAGLHPKVTLRTLLNHSSGLPDFSLSEEFLLLQYQVPVNYRNLFDCVRDIPMNFEPGKGSNYCNFNFFLASLVIEEVTGESFESFVQREVFDALDIKNTTIDEVSKLIDKRASGYDANGMDIVSAPYLNINWMKGAGAAIGTVEDVYQLNRAIKNKKLLKEETWKQVFTPTTAGYGLGCTVSNWYGKKRYTHNGGYHGFRTLHIQLPEDDFDIIILSNMGFGNARVAFSEAIYRIYYQNDENIGRQLDMNPSIAIGGELVYDVMNPQRPAEIEINDAQEYTGYYSNNTRCAKVTFEKGEWNIELDNYKHLPVYPIGKDIFYHKLIDESYTFTRDSEGNLMFMGMYRQR